MTLELVVGDITKLAVGAIVNAANRALSGGGGVDGAIHRAAGPELVIASRALGPCATGDAVITPGFRLPAKLVIHAVGPVWGSAAGREDDLLASCYRRSLSLAREAGADSIAFPCISTGAYRFPRDRAARIALRTVSGHATGVDRVVFCCFDEADADLYRRAAAGLGVELTG